MKKLTTRSKLFAFAPALVVICTTAFIASGASLITGATAASSVGVEGEVAASFSTDPGTTVGGGATGCDDETLSTFASAFAASNGCQISFASNGTNGAEVSFENGNTGVGQSEAFFCSDGDDAGAHNIGTRDCSTDAGRVDDAVGTGQTIAASSDTFGLALRAVGGGAAAGAGVSGVDATPTGAEAIWSGIPANGAGTILCDSSGPTTASTCDFVFGGAGEGAGQGAGDYAGTLDVTTALL